eukprot:scaffold11267_cov116-Skeletonema_marinoi.AAC.2
MDGLSHYLQSSTQGAMIVPTQPTNKLKKLPQQQEDCVPPQYFSNSMSVLPRIDLDHIISSTIGM